MSFSFPELVRSVSETSLRENSRRSWLFPGPKENFWRNSENSPEPRDVLMKGVSHRGRQSCLGSTLHLNNVSTFHVQVFVEDTASAFLSFDFYLWPEGSRVVRGLLVLYRSIENEQRGDLYLRSSPGPLRAFQGLQGAQKGSVRDPKSLKREVNLRVSWIPTFTFLDVLNRGPRFPTNQIATGLLRFQIPEFESQGQEPFELLLGFCYLIFTVRISFKSRDSIGERFKAASAWLFELLIRDI